MLPYLVCFHSFFIIVILLLAATLSRSEDEVTNFTGYQVYQTNLTTRGQVMALRQLAQLHNLDIWSGPHLNRSTDILVSPEQLDFLKLFLQQNDLIGAVKIPNVQKFIDNSKLIKTSANKRKMGQMSWDAYYEYDEIEAWLREVNRQYPNLTSLEIIGNTYENRNLTLIKISGGNKSLNTKPEGVFIDAGFHAREWIGIAVATYIINELTQNHQKYDAILNNFEVYIVPIVNADGYEHTHNANRLWRKNRAPTPSVYCVGVDLNRNFPNQWGTVTDSGSSNACKNEYRGSSPCSEKECQALVKFIESHPDITTYISLHSYGQYWLYPFSYAKRKPPNENELKLITTSSVLALEAVYGSRYTIGSSADVFLYTASGVSTDWAITVPNIKYAYVLELRDKGDDGFVLGNSKIMPTAVETWAGIKTAITREFINGTHKNPSTGWVTQAHFGQLDLIILLGITNWFF